MRYIIIWLLPIICISQEIPSESRLYFGDETNGLKLAAQIVKMSNYCEINVILTNSSSKTVYVRLNRRSNGLRVCLFDGMTNRIGCSAVTLADGPPAAFDFGKTPRRDQMHRPFPPGRTFSSGGALTSAFGKKLASARTVMVEQYVEILAEDTKEFRATWIPAVRIPFEAKDASETER
jgi:hypothetical protein